MAIMRRKKGLEEERDEVEGAGRKSEGAKEKGTMGMGGTGRGVGNIKEATHFITTIKHHMCRMTTE